MSFRLKPAVVIILAHFSRSCFLALFLVLARRRSELMIFRAAVLGRSTCRHHRQGPNIGRPLAAHRRRTSSMSDFRTFPHCKRGSAAAMLPVQDPAGWTPQSLGPV